MPVTEKQSPTRTHLRTRSLKWMLLKKAHPHRNLQPKKSLPRQLNRTKRRSLRGAMCPSTLSQIPTNTTENEKVFIPDALGICQARNLRTLCSRICRPVFRRRQRHGRYQRGYLYDFQLFRPGNEAHLCHRCRGGSHRWCQGLWQVFVR